MVLGPSAKMGKTMFLSNVLLLLGGRVKKPSGILYITGSVQTQHVFIPSRNIVLLCSMQILHLYPKQIIIFSLLEALCLPFYP